MELEQQRGISITSTAMAFGYDGLQLNLLDTPGHADFSEARRACVCVWRVRVAATQPLGDVECPDALFTVFAVLVRACVRACVHAPDVASTARLPPGPEGSAGLRDRRRVDGHVLHTHGLHAQHMTHMTHTHTGHTQDTYRTLAAADNAVMLVDGAKGIEPQTRKLFEVARMRRLPIFTCVQCYCVCACSAACNHLVLT